MLHCPFSLAPPRGQFLLSPPVLRWQEGQRTSRSAGRSRPISMLRPEKKVRPVLDMISRYSFLYFSKFRILLARPPGAALDVESESPGSNHAARHRPAIASNGI